MITQTPRMPSRTAWRAAHAERCMREDGRNRSFILNGCASEPENSSIWQVYRLRCPRPIDFRGSVACPLCQGCCRLVSKVNDTMRRAEERTTDGISRGAEGIWQTPRTPFRSLRGSTGRSEGKTAKRRDNLSHRTSVRNQQANNHASQSAGIILCRITYLCWDRPQRRRPPRQQTCRLSGCARQAPRALVRPDAELETNGSGLAQSRAVRNPARRPWGRRRAPQ